MNQLFSRRLLALLQLWLNSKILRIRRLLLFQKIGNVSISGDLVVSGNLTISGNTTTLNTETLSIEDSTIVLNSTATGSPNSDAGIEIERGDSNNVFIRWSESNDKWQFTNDGTTYVNIASTADVSNHEADTTNVHGIANTANLATLTDVASSITSHENDVTNIHGIANTALLVTLAETQTLTNKTLASPIITGISPQITLSGDLTGSVTLTDLSSATLNAVISADSVALGTDTTGNYMSNVTAGTGISVTHTPGEGSSASIALNATLDDLSNVNVSSPSDGQFLKYVASSSTWVPAAIPTINNLDDVGDVVITSGTANQMLQYDGTNWVNTSNPTVGGNLTVTGNLTVSGTTVTVNSETLTINDNIIVLNNNEAGTPSENAGIEVERGTSTNVVLRWNEADDYWEFSNDGTIYQRIVGDTIINAQSAAYTLVLADRSKMVEMNIASGHNLTVPTNANVAFPTGTTITILQTGAGQTTVVGQSGVTVNATPGTKLRAQYSSATLIKRATNTWVLVGDISA
jgi:hypothetical protein